MLMFDVETIKTILAGSAGSAIALVSLYFARDAVLAAMNRSAQKDLETKKIELQKEIEKFKSDLEREKDRHRHDLARDAAKITMYNAKSHDLYAELFELLRRAEGAVGLLTGLRQLPDWEKLSKKDIEEAMIEYGIPPDKACFTLAHLESNKHKTIEAVRGMYRLQDQINAEEKTRTAKNFTILKEIYISEEITGKTFELLKLFNDIIIDVEFMDTDASFRKSAHENNKKTGPLLIELRRSIQKELLN